MTKVVRPFITSSSAACTLGFGGGVERAGRFVEDQDRRVLEQRARDREPLALAAGEQPAALADRRRKPSGVALDEIERLGARAASRISASVASGLPTRRFSAIERLNSSASWNTTPILRRSATA